MSPPFLPAPFGVLICLRPAAVRLPLVTVPEGQQLYSWFWNVANAESVFYPVSIRTPAPFVPLRNIANARYCFRTLAYNCEPFHSCSCLFSTSLRLQQLRCVLIAPPKAHRKAPLLCLFMRVTVFTNCQRLQYFYDIVILPPISLTLRSASRA